MNDNEGRPPPRLATDAGPLGFSDFMVRTRFIEGAPAPPPPVPGENDPNPDGLRINDIIATRVAGGVRIPGGLEDTPTPVSALGDEPTATATVEPTATATADATATVEPVATDTPEPTVTPEPAPTPELEDTATAEPEVAPTATPEPVPTPEPEPTATPEPVVEPTATPEPAPVVEPTATATPEPVIEPTTDIPNFSANTKPNFATIPLNGYWTNRTYTYNLCANRFVNPNSIAASVWMNDIQAAIDRLAGSVQWRKPDGSNIIVAAGTVDTDCTTSEIALGSTHNAVFLAANNSELVHYCGMASPGDTTLACAASTGSNGIKSSNHMVFRPAALTVPGWNPGGSSSSIAPTSCSKLFDVALHEAGHAFGLGHVPSNISIMRENRTVEICNPQDVDVGALMTIYQSNTWSNRGVP